MNEKLIRTFLAIPVPDEVKSKKKMLYSTLEQTEGSIYWVKNLHLHLTLKFLGHTPESSIDGVSREVEKVTHQISPFKLTIKGTGCFPIPTRPRTLWLGVGDNLNHLTDLVKQIENLLYPLGFPNEEREYHPHITVARIKYPQKYTPNIDPFLKSSYDPIDFSVDRVQYFSSELTPSGAIYTLLKTFPLGETL